MAASQPSYDRFAVTRWSMVLQQACGNSPEATRALDELAQRYWHPVYAYVRRCGHAPAIAQDISRTFLQHLIGRFRGADEAPAHGHFRTFLLSALNTFLGEDWRESAGDEVGPPLLPPEDLEARYLRDVADSTSPEQAYQRSFAFEVLARALRRLQAEAVQTGHEVMFQALVSLLPREPVPGEMDAIGTRLSIRPLALLVALKRLRQRFRELIAQELADTVTTGEDMAAEQAILHEALRSLK